MSVVCTGRRGIPGSVVKRHPGKENVWLSTLPISVVVAVLLKWKSDSGMISWIVTLVEVARTNSTSLWDAELCLVAARTCWSLGVIGAAAAIRFRTGKVPVSKQKASVINRVRSCRYARGMRLHGTYFH